jgi:hypothetical protein
VAFGFARLVWGIGLAGAAVVVPGAASRAQAAGGDGKAPVYTEQRNDPFYTTDRMDWPGPNQYRDASGAPGPAYWQQRADYAIAATLDTATRTITGTVTVHYTNNSPDTLRWVWMQLDQNLFRQGSKGSAVFAADSRWGARNFAGGYTLGAITADGAAVAPKADDTMMRLDLAQPLAPRGGKLTIVVHYAFEVPDHGADRMGRDGTLYEIAQWYPRMAVYDDVRGWNTDPYIGQGEFYLEYGDIDYAVTAPSGYTVAGSGVLQNPAEVLTPTQRQRLATAAHDSAVVPIITAAESEAAKTTHRPGMKTWRFRAMNVRDVAWGAAPDFRWDATSTGAIPGNPAGVLCQAYYQEPRAGRAWESGAEQTQWTIRHYSRLVFPFPYPQATSVAGPVGGMEYPMFVMVHYGTEDPASIFSTVNHEHGHEWFPMIVGSNERRYAWMDEGVNTYINAFANELRVPGSSAWGAYMTSWRQAVERGIQAPLMAAPDHIDGAALGAIGYRKPGAVLLTLRDNVVGRETMDLALREYVRRWAYKHPTPGDFFRTMENVSGQDLSWFWRGFFYSDDVLDIGIDSVKNRAPQVSHAAGDGAMGGAPGPVVRTADSTQAPAASGGAGGAPADPGQRTAVIYLRRNTSIVFPVTLRLGLSDGSTQDVSLPVDIWAQGNAFAATVEVRAPVTGARLWPDPFVPDMNSTNDTWGTPPPGGTTASPSTTGGLSGLQGHPVAQ